MKSDPMQLKYCQPVFVACVYYIPIDKVVSNNLKAQITLQSGASTQIIGAQPVASCCACQRHLLSPLASWEHASIMDGLNLQFSLHAIGISAHYLALNLSQTYSSTLSQVR